MTGAALAAPEDFFGTPPRRHQREYFNVHKDDYGHGIFFDPGLGKSWTNIHEVAWLYEQGKIDAWVITAPNSLKRTWTLEQIPTHMPARILRKAKIVLWISDEAEKAKAKLEREDLLKHDGLAIFVLNYSGGMSTTGHKYLKKFFSKRKAMFSLDECQNIKNPAAKRTIRFVSLGAWAPYRRALTGTPMVNGLFDIYAQIKFLDPKFFVDRGCASFTAFKHFFGIYRKQFGRGGVQFDDFVGYKNEAILREWLKLISTRLTEDEAGLDLPPLLFKKVYFEMAKKQRAMYDELRDELRTEIRGQVINGAQTLTRLIRLQQIARGYAGVTKGEEREIHHIFDDPEDNPRVEALVENVCAGNDQTIIWSDYTEDLLMIEAVLKRHKRRPAVFHGQTKEKDRQRIVEAFNAGEITDFVANPGTGGAGLTLLTGRRVFYYANGYKLEHRLQSQKRSHRDGQKQTVFVTDVTSEGTVDEDIIDALREKKDIEALAFGGQIKEWI